MSDHEHGTDQPREPAEPGGLPDPGAGPPDPTSAAPGEQPTEHLGWPPSGPAYAGFPPDGRPEPPAAFLGYPPYEPPPARRRRNSALSAAGLLLAGLAVGGVAVWALQSQNTDPTSAADSQIQNGGQGAGGFGPGQGGQNQGGTGQNGTGQNGTGQNGGQGFRGLAGEQRLAGTITAIGSSTVTLRSQAGTATYTVVSDTEILRDGAQATLSQLKVGDVALVHVYPSGSRMLVERIFAGALPQGRFGGPPGSGQAPDDRGGSVTTTSGVTST